MGDSDDENFVTFGSALEPLDEDNLPRKKPVTIEDQYAVDAQGRRRFHGAFTGGFSAGYFNSVGTRDGWKPQQFKSSRSSKAGGVSQRVEDFMDEEDTSEFGIAPTAIRAHSDFTDHGRRGAKRERPKQDNDGPIPGVPVLQEILKPAKDTVGVTLLKKMGWRPGQGIGPRVTKREKTKTREKNEKMKIYGCSLPTARDKMEESTSEGSEDESSDILFAPDDYEPFLCNPKDNYFGIGYTGLDRRPVLSGHLNLFEPPAAFKLQEKNKKLSIRGQAFGVGAFEADDEDIYQRDDMSRYDFSLGPAETKTKSRWSRKNDAETSKENCLEGFTPAKNKLERKKLFEAPELPKDFKPFHAVRKSRFYPPIEAVATSDGRRRGLGRHDLNATDRSVILGESSNQGQNVSAEIGKSPNVTIPEPTGSQVAHNIITRTLNLHGKDQVEERRQQEAQSSKTSSWLEKLTSKSFVKGGIEGSDPSATGSLKNLQDFKSNIVETSGHQYSRPFQTDPDKQKRFEKFVELTRQGDTEKLSSLQPLSMTEWERNHEKEEFSQAARLFEKSLEDKSKELKLAASSISDKFVAIGAEEAAPSVAKTLDDQMKNAAKMKLFGKLTRQREPWQPASLVCKRFNIPEPRIGCPKADNKPKNKRYSVFDSLDFGGSSERFERATDTSGSFKEPHIPYKPKESPENEEGPRNASRIFDVSDISATAGKSAEKMRNFEASYEKVFGHLAATSGTKMAEPKRREIQISSQENSISEEKTEEILEPKDNSVEKKDLFKAIFLSSSEDEGNEEEEDDEEAVKSLLIGKAPGELNVQRNTSPPRGIFAKLDLDSLTKPEKADDRLKGAKSRGDKNDEGDKMADDIRAVDENNDCRETRQPEVELLPDMYGPVLPSKALKSAETSDNGQATFSRDSETQKAIFKSVVVTKVDSSDDKLKGKWVERTKVKKSKKEKHKHKHKEKERSRHKHKKKDKR